MRVILVVATLLLLSVMPRAAYAEYPVYLKRGMELGLVENSTIEVLDDVSDNCWTNAQTTRSRVFLIFEQNGLFVPDYKPAFFGPQTVVTELSAVGFRTNSGICAVSATFVVQTIIYNNLGGVSGKKEYSFRYVADLFQRQSIFTNGGNSNDQIKDFFEGAASEFVAMVLSAKRSKEFTTFRELYPSEGTRPMSIGEWERIVDSAAASEGG